MTNTSKKKKVVSSENNEECRLIKIAEEVFRHNKQFFLITNIINCIRMLFCSYKLNLLY